MSAAMHPAAPHHLPAFITEPGETDYLLVGSGVFLVLIVLVLGTVYFRLHALPEHLAHRHASKLQFEVVAVLALLALFTHNNTLWIVALLLALVPIPDLYGPLARMADALAKMAGGGRAAAEAGSPLHDQPGDAPSAAAIRLSPGSKAATPVAPKAVAAGWVAALHRALAHVADALAKMAGWRRGTAEAGGPLHDQPAVTPTPEAGNSLAADGTHPLERT